MPPDDIEEIVREKNNDVAALDPPFALHSVRYARATVEFDDGFIVPFLARRGFRPRPDLIGGIAAYDAPHGYGITPYTAAHIWINVEGYDSTDGTNGAFLLGGFYSANALPALQRLRGEGIVEGGSRQDRDDHLLTATGGGGGVRMRLAMQFADAAPEKTSGVRFFVHNAGDGEIQISHCSWAGTRFTSLPVDVALDVPPANRLSGLRIRRVVDSHWLEMSLTLGVSVRVGGDRARASEPDLLHVLARFGRGAVLLDAAGRVLFANTAAEAALAALAGTAMPDGDSGFGDARVQLLVDRVLRVAPAGPEFGPVAVPRKQGGRPYLMSCSLLDPRPRDGGRTRRLLLFTDPAASDDGGAYEAMRVLGLTAAEARVAVLVGSGLAPREAARTIGNSEGTVRFMLQRVYEKLDIGRQSELAAMVARAGQAARL